MNQEHKLTYVSIQDELKKLLLEKPTISILKYVRDNQAHESSITKGQIVRYLNDNEISSRLTTLKLIQRLLDYEILLNDKKRDNTYSRLIINPSFDFRAIETDLLVTYLKEFQKHFEDFSNESKGANTVLIFNLLSTIDKFSKQEEMYRVKQSTKLRDEPEPVRYHKKAS